MHVPSIIPRVRALRPRSRVVGRVVSTVDAISVVAEFMGSFNRRRHQCGGRDHG